MIDSPVIVDELRRTYVLRKGRLSRSTRTVEALEGISFEVRRGELFGLVGPNGAGKTTTIRILTTLLVPSSGMARVLGLDVTRDAKRIRRRIGILFGGERGLYGRVSAWQNLRYFANLYGLPTNHSSRRIEEVLAVTGLSERAGDRVDTFSRGMKQRLHIARALLHEPELIFLDEPTVGLDPIAAREIRDLVRRLRAAGTTILLSTHYMLEADELCDRVGIIDRGRLLALAAPDALRDEVPDLFVVEVELLSEPATWMLDRVRALAGADTVISADQRADRHVLRIQSRRGRELVDELPEALREASIGAVVLREPTLEDVYVRMISGARQQDSNGELVQV
jgi:ABC-2 type transport system ATP-binding protein